MKRPLPTRELLIELCGGNQGLISAAHHGLAETHLIYFYPYLDLDETIAFAASSWKSRENDLNDYFTKFVQSANIYELFSEVFKIGFPWLNKHKRISSKLEEKYRRLNPFRGTNLKARLERVAPKAIQKLEGGLQEEVNEWVFECDYLSRTGDKSNLKNMNFQNFYPKEVRIVPAYAAEIARMMQRYPNEYSLDDLAQKQELTGVPARKTKQPTLSFD